MGCASTAGTATSGPRARRPMADTLQGPCLPSAVIDAELCFLTGTGAPNFASLQLALRSRHHHKLTVFVDFLHRDDIDLRPLPLYQRKLRLQRVIARSDIPCLHLVESFDDGVKLLKTAERVLLEGIVSKRRNSHYRSGDCRDWVKIKTEIGARRTGSGGASLSAA